MLHHVLYLAFTAVLSFSSVQSLATTPTSYTLFEKLQQTPDGWIRLDTQIPADTRIRLNIHLTQQNEDVFEKMLLQVSEPGHVEYGNHKTQEELNEMLAPHEESFGEVQAWLFMQNTTTIEIHHDNIVLELTVSQAEALLQTEYAYYRDSSSDKIIMRTESYSLPANLHSHVAFVQPTTMFGLARPQTAMAMLAAEPAIVTSLAPTCNDTITPSCLSYLYGFNGYTPIANSQIGIAGFLYQSAQEKDIKSFLTKYAPLKPTSPLKSTPFNIISISGGTTSQSGLKTGEDIRDITEANLDVSYTSAITLPITNTFYSTGYNAPSLDNGNEPYIAFLTYMLKLKTLPQTLTISYDDFEDNIPKAYAQKVCNMFGQLGARGVSVLVSSGDTGPGASCSSLTAKFGAVFPASCNYVTAVGATKYIKPEVASGLSGGGFSTYFSRPSYQEVAVARFFRRQRAVWTPFAVNINRGGRAFPDISAQGERFAVNINGTIYQISGTSASAPTVAAIVALLNSERIKLGEKSLGFLNPWLYSDAVAKAGGLTDIVGGSSTGCLGFDKTGRTVEGGWKAVKGYDLSTGLGTPNFKGLMKALCSK